MDFSYLLTHRIAHEPRAGVTAGGDPAYGARQTLDACVEFKSEIVRRGASGDEAQSSSQVAVQAEVKEGDRIWLLSSGEDPDTHGGHEVLSVAAVADLSGEVCLWRIYL